MSTPPTEPGTPQEQKRQEIEQYIGEVRAHLSGDALEKFNVAAGKLRELADNHAGASGIKTFSGIFFDRQRKAMRDERKTAGFQEVDAAATAAHVTDAYKELSGYKEGAKVAGRKPA